MIAWGLVLIVLGASGEFVLRGTGSGAALMAVGALLVVIGLWRKRAAEGGLPILDDPTALTIRLRGESAVSRVISDPQLHWDVTLKGYRSVLRAMQASDPAAALVGVDHEAAGLNRRIKGVDRDPVGAMVYWAYREALDYARELGALSDAALDEDVRRTAERIREFPDRDSIIGRLAVAVAERRRRQGAPPLILANDLGATRSALLAEASLPSLADQA